MNEETNETKVAKKIWNNYNDEERRKELSHWRGAGKFKDDDMWLGIGKRSKKSLDNLIKNENRFWDRDCVILEWGSGGGANAFELCNFSSVYYGVDVSSKNLQEAERVCSIDSLGKFHPVLINNSPEEVLSSVEKSINLFLSTAVFQHFPSKSYGIEVLKILFKMCAPDALGMLQIRYDDGSEKFAGNNSIDEYNKNFIIATTYTIEEFWRACNDVGFQVIYINNLNDNVKYVTFYLKK
jgi:hypothetical protein